MLKTITSYVRCFRGGCRKKWREPLIFTFVFCYRTKQKCTGINLTSFKMSDLSRFSFDHLLFAQTFVLSTELNRYLTLKHLIAFTVILKMTELSLIFSRILQPQNHQWPVFELILRDDWGIHTAANNVCNTEISCTLRALCVWGQLYIKPFSK